MVVIYCNELNILFSGNFIMIWGFWTFLFLACVLVKGIVTTGSTDSLLDKALSNYNDKDRQDIIQNFESSLLKIFGLKSRPKPSAHIKIPQYMLDLFEQHNTESPSFHFANSKAGSANTVRSFVHTGMFVFFIYFRPFFAD